MRQVYKLYLRLLKRGYPPNNTKNIIIEATSKLQKTKKCFHSSTTLSSKSTSPNSNLNTTLIFKTTFHKTINKRYLRKLLHNHLNFQKEPESKLNFTRTIIAFKKQRNLQEHLFPSNLKVPSKLAYLFDP